MFSRMYDALPAARCRVVGTAALILEKTIPVVPTRQEYCGTELRLQPDAPLLFEINYPMKLGVSAKWTG